MKSDFVYKKKKNVTKIKMLHVCDMPNPHKGMCICVIITKLKCHGLTAYIILCCLPNILVFAQMNNTLLPSIYTD